jgi:caffeoyl-CoA O-methyltransferase
VTVQLGPATEGLARLPDTPVDLAYIDADKTGYPAYYDALLPRLRAGGVIVLDNTLLRGRVLDPQDERATVMAELNERIAADHRVDSVLLGLSDGVTLARKRAGRSRA